MRGKPPPVEDDILIVAAVVVENRECIVDVALQDISDGALMAVISGIK